jgi:ribosomal protein S18 acetylase RimI-like enzyme
MRRPILLDEILALDALCLRDPTGGPLDLGAHSAQLRASALKSSFATIRRNGNLVAYGYMWPLGEGRWFVGGLLIHPEHRNASVTAELLRNFLGLVYDSDATELHSHVLASNTLSVRLHRRLGFAEIQRDERAIAFVAHVADLKVLPVLRAADSMRS